MSHHPLVVPPFIGKGDPTLSPDFRKLIAPQAKVLMVIWAALAFSTLIYVAVAWFIVGPADPAGAGTAGIQGTVSVPLKGIGLAVLVVLGVAATYYQRRALAASTLKKKIPANPVWPPAGSQGAPGMTGKGREIFASLSDSEKRLASLWPHYQTSMIVVGTMLEAMALVGLILAIVQRDFRIVIPFAVASLIMLVLKRPRPGSFFEAVRL